MAYRIHNVGIDCNDLRGMSQFWQSVTGFVTKSSDDDHVYMKAADDSFGLFMQKVPEGRTEKNRLHLDLVVDDLEAATSEVTGFGAALVSKQDGWNVLADPEGNQFCLVPA